MKKTTGIFLIYIIFVSVCSADGFKKYAGEFLNNGVGARAMSLGGAYVAVTNDVTAGFWNPAGLTEASGLQVQFMHARQFLSSVQYDYLGVSRQFNSDLTLGFSMIRLGVSNIQDSRNALIGESLESGGSLDLSKIKMFSTADYAFLFSYARNYNDNISYGANVKLIYRDFSSETAMGIGFDAGIVYQILPGMRIGAVLRDVTSTMMAWSTDEKEFITPSFRPGVAYRFDFDDIGLYFQPSLDLNILFESRDSAAQLNLGPLSMDSFWGLEAGFKNVSFLRLGFDDLQRFNGGLGVSITRFAVDYSYTNFDQELGNVHRISFHLKLNGF